MYRLSPTRNFFQLSLHCLIAVPSWDSLQSFVWQMIWNEQARSAAWRDAKIPITRNVVALRFEVVGAEVSIGKISWTPMASVPFAHLTAGSCHACVLHVSFGEIRCWGRGGFGQLGRGDQEDIGDGPGEMGNQLSLVDLGTGRSAKQISSGYEHVCAVLDDDSLKCWGDGSLGRLGYESTSNVGDRPNTMGDHLPPVDLGTGRSAKQVSAGGGHTCAVLDDDSLKCWGFNHYGQLGYGHQYNIGDSPNTMGDHLPSVDLGTGRKVKQVSTYTDHTCAVLDDDSLKCWGFGWSGRLGYESTSNVGDRPNTMGDHLPPVDLGTGRSAKQVSAGGFHTCAVLDDDSLKCWGWGLYGRLGYENGYNIGDSPNTMGDQLPSVDLGAGRRAKQVSSGRAHTCALLDNDSIKCWGGGSGGELGVRYPHNPDLGDGPDEMGDHLLPVELGSGRTGQQVISGNDYSCALLDDDSVKCWGSNNCGRLGQGNVEHIGDGPNEMGDSLIPIDFGTILTSIISKSVRIVGTTRQGRVQVQYQQTWRDVCDDNWNILNAQVVCRQLGLAGGISLIHLNGSGEFGMDEVACEGNEFDLGYCPFRGWGIHDCSAQEAAGVKCHVDAWSTMPDPNIPARRGHSAIWNDDDDSMLVFAGHAAASFHFYNDLWRYKQDGRDGFWEEVQTVGPSPRGGHTAIWDRAGAMLVFGGSYLTTNFDELWIYSANTSSWSLASPPMKPKARAYHSGVWDAASQMMLIFAGENNGALQDLWQYQLALNNWTELSVFSFSEMPSARSRHTAVWIDAAKAMLVFGGWADTALNDLWHYALWSNSWTQLFTSSSPAGRAGHSAVWEPLTWSMLIFGGVRVNESINYTAEVSCWWFQRCFFPD